MEDSLIASIDVMEGGDGVEVSHTRLNTLEEFLGIAETEERNLLSCSTDIKNMVVETEETPVGRTLKKRRILDFKRFDTLEKTFANIFSSKDFIADI